MKPRGVAIVCVSVVAAACVATVLFMFPKKVTYSDEVLDVTVCQLESNPAMYDHKLVKVSGRMTYGFEDFTLSDLACGRRNSVTSIWVEYGGTSSSGTMYCCGVTAERTRAKPLVINGVVTTLNDSAEFQQLDELLHQEPSRAVRATVIGRFFAGEKTKFPDGKTRWAGFGHMGIFSLLVIQEVIGVQET